MILGVPFLRNTYTVMAYTPPNSDGSFPPLNTTTTITTSSSDDDGIASDDDQPPSRISTQITPMLGLLPLTDPTRALQEFNTVHILNQPLSSSTATPNTGSNANTQTVRVGGKKLSIGIVILIGLLSFFALCCALFLIRWLLFRRKYKKQRKGAFGDSSDAIDQKTAYRLARRTSLGALGTVPVVGGLAPGQTLTEDELRELRYRSYIRKSGKGLSESTVGSDRTLAAESYVVKGEDGEFGYIKRHKSRDDDDDDGAEDEDDVVAWGNDTLVAPRKSAVIRAGDEPHHHGSDEDSTHSAPAEARPLVGGDSASPPSSPDQPTFPHARTYSDGPDPALDASPRTRGHASMPSVQQPLLGPAARSRTQSSGYLDEVIVANHARLFSVDAADPTANDLLQPLPPAAVRLVPQPPARQDSNVLDMAEFGGSPTRTAEDEDVHTSMAGIGSASRGSRFLGLGPRPSIDSLPFNRESLMSVSTVGTVVGPGVALGSPTDLDSERRVDGSSLS